MAVRNMHLTKKMGLIKRAKMRVRQAKMPRQYRVCEVQKGWTRSEQRGLPL